MRGYPVGFPRALIWTYATTGARKGTALGQIAAAVNGSASGAFVLPDVKTANLAPVAPASIDIEGGDRIVASPNFGGGKTAAFDLTSSSLDTALVALVAGSTPNTTNSEYTIVGPNSNRSTPRSLGCGIQQRYETSDGDAYFLTRFFPVCNMFIGVGQAGFRAGTDTTINVNPVNTTKAHDGRSFGSAGLNLGYQDDTGDTYWWISSYPIHIITHASDASDVEFNTIYKPVSTVVTVTATGNAMVKNGTATALSSITLAGVVTLAAAGTAGDLHVLTYTTEYVPV